MGTRAPLGGLVLREPIGRGGMGEVWRASDPRRGTDVAVKVLTPTAARAPRTGEGRDKNRDTRAADESGPGRGPCPRRRQAESPGAPAQAETQTRPAEKTSQEEARVREKVR